MICLKQRVAGSIRCLLAVLFVAAIHPPAIAQTLPLSEKTAKPTETESRLQSLRRSVESATDIKVVLDRYSRFIEQYKDSPVVKDAERDAAVWKDRQDKGMVKVGSRWVTAAERAAMKLKAGTTAVEARDEMLRFRLPEAEALIRRALEEDPASPGALYLDALLQYEHNKIPLAKKAFDTVAAAVPLEGPTLNNLAVIQWGLSQPVMAMKYYEQAMVAARLNRDILHNVAEAINLLPANQKTTIVAANAIRVYETQVGQLTKKLESEGLHAWGSTWVDQATLAQLEVIEKRIAAKVTFLSGEYEKLQKQVDTLEQDIAANERSMQLMQNATSYKDAKGVSHSRPLSPQYDVLQEQNTRLRSDIGGLHAKQGEFRSQAELAKRELPVQKYTSIQKMIGAEGMPVVSSTASSTTKPASR